MGKGVARGFPFGFASIRISVLYLHKAPVLKPNEAELFSISHFPWRHTD